MPRTLVEICIESPDDARAAAGADRLEICQALAAGGLTPSPGAQQEIRRIATLPLMTMIRPRPGGFTYSASEFTVMQRDIDAAIDFAADGIVFGLLTENATIDLPRTTQLIRQIRSSPRPIDVVFHRAFDFTPDPFDALDRLIDVGVTRVLTSGQKTTALQGAPLIRDLIHRAAGRIQILPAAGIRPENARPLIDQTGCTQLHASLRRPLRDRTFLSGAASLAAGPARADLSTTSTATDAEDLRALLESLPR